MAKAGLTGQKRSLIVMTTSLRKLLDRHDGHLKKTPKRGQRHDAADLSRVVSS